MMTLIFARLMLSSWDVISRNLKRVLCCSCRSFITEMLSLFSFWFSIFLVSFYAPYCEFQLPCGGETPLDIKCKIADLSVCAANGCDKEQVMSCKLKGLTCLHGKQPELNGEQCKCCDYKVRYLCAGMSLYGVYLIQEVLVFNNKLTYRNMSIVIHLISMRCNVCWQNLVEPMSFLCIDRRNRSNLPVTRFYIDVYNQYNW